MKKALKKDDMGEVIQRAFNNALIAFIVSKVGYVDSRIYDAFENREQMGEVILKRRPRLKLCKPKFAYNLVYRCTMRFLKRGDPQRALFKKKRKRTVKQLSS